MTSTNNVPSGKIVYVRIQFELSASGTLGEWDLYSDFYNFHYCTDITISTLNTNKKIIKKVDKYLKKALKNIEKTIKSDPENRELIIHKAEILNRHGKYVEALDLLLPLREEINGLILPVLFNNRKYDDVIEICVTI